MTLVRDDGHSRVDLDRWNSALASLPKQVCDKGRIRGRPDARDHIKPRREFSLQGTHRVLDGRRAARSTKSRPNPRASRCSQHLSIRRAAGLHCSRSSTRLAGESETVAPSAGSTSHAASSAASATARVSSPSASERTARNCSPGEGATTTSGSGTTSGISRSKTRVTTTEASASASAFDTSAPSSGSISASTV